MNSRDTNSREWISWNGNIRHRYHTLHEPSTEEELARVVGAARSIRPLGNGQSSADIAGGAEELISFDRYQGVLKVDQEKREVTARAGTPLGVLLAEIDRQGWSLSALPDIDTVTLAGAIATGTHGTAGAGRLLGNHMVACRLVTARGEVREFREDDPEMPALRLSLGVLGVFSTITLRCDPGFRLAVTERPVKDEVWQKGWPELLQTHPFLRILYLPHTGYGYVITGDYATEPQGQGTRPWWITHRRAVSARLYQRTVRHPSFTVTANKILKKLFFSHTQRAFGTLYEATVTKSRGSTLELAEWTVAQDRFPELFAELGSALRDRTNPAFVHIPMDVRFLKADNTWLSYACERDCVTLGCVCRVPEAADSYAAFGVVEEIFRRYGGRPHWAKRHAMRGDDFADLYPRWQDFLDLRQRMDPQGTFLTPSLKELLGID
ncbi:dehydrogenase [Alkalispirochaeta sphaeroplastigenens]|uniref:Dehydrogenase n=1 Tax=Alkalispirochaeta sphaeroplastigenens TaxID=1187066 RepID=A0A2S4JS27_9SPIO|nr:D-arabinono-1,4-lactone oxidase [Alkalispirochaeta sphaeroplastigenens]POR02292.1 dehydrogenase [Alkalispirochaeta sphaeroplastigenens]